MAAIPVSLAHVRFVSGHSGFLRLLQIAGLLRQQRECEVWMSADLWIVLFPVTHTLVRFMSGHCGFLRLLQVAGLLHQQREREEWMSVDLWLVLLTLCRHGLRFFMLQGQWLEQSQGGKC